MERLQIISERLTKSIGTPTSIIIHTFIFAGIFSLSFFGYTTEEILLILTTAVSLEAIYLAIFIQMTVNKATATIAEVEKDVDEIQEDIDEIQEDVDEIQEDVDEIQEDKVINSIKNIEKKIILLHKEIIEIKNKK
ncbi:MAG: hypothetical protein WCG91_00085 [Candidatus Shapirobacteria bacterium]